MGNELEKEYNIKSKPLKLPGAYNFLRFINHPTQQLSLLVVKHPHKVTVLDSTVLLPIREIKESNDSCIAVCPRCVPLSLVKPSSQTEMKILMCKILKSRSQIGRCFLSRGRILLWCEEKRGLSSMAPQELEHGRVSEQSKVFTAGITLLNFLHCVYEREKFVEKKSKKKQKDSKSKGDISKPLDVAKEVLANMNSKLDTPFNIPQLKTTDNEQLLPTEVKLFFDPLHEKQYHSLLDTLEARLSKTSFWNSISEGLRQLILNMLSRDPSQRVDLKTILSIPYFENCQELKLYFTLVDEFDSGRFDRQHMLVFMSALELIIKQGTVFKDDILENYICPILEEYALEKQGSKGSKNMAAQALSALIELNKPPVHRIYNCLRQAQVNDRNMIKMVLEKREKLFHLLPTEMYDSAVSRVAFCGYETDCADILTLTILATPDLMSWVQEEKYRKEIEFKLISKIIENANTTGNQTEQSRAILLIGLKCSIELLRRQTMTSTAKYQEISIDPRSQTDLEINIHALHLYSLLIEHIPCSTLLQTIFAKLQPFLSGVEVSNELFLEADKVFKKAMSRLFKHRKLDPSEEVELEYSEDYFKFKAAKKDSETEELSEYQRERKKLNQIVSKNEMNSLQWLFRDII